jgi:hypothetical protein
VGVVVLEWRPIVVEAGVAPRIWFAQCPGEALHQSWRRSHGRQYRVRVEGHLNWRIVYRGVLVGSSSIGPLLREGNHRSRMRKAGSSTTLAMMIPITSDPIR